MVGRKPRLLYAGFTPFTPSAVLWSSYTSADPANPGRRDVCHMNTQYPTSEGSDRWRSFALVALLALILVVVLALYSGHSSAAPQPMPTPFASGGGEYVLAEGDELSDTDRAEIERELRANIQQLSQSGQLTAAQSSAAVALDWPLKPKAGFSDPSYYGVSGYVDHNPAFPGQVQDFMCGARSYDTSGGYNHAGTDYFLWPFAWNKMAAGDITIVAAAPGVIVNKSEGNPDQSCSFNSNKWNAVYVRHADGSIAWYGHMKQGSVTTKAIGDTVQTGEYLGLVGSSGNSTGPHLHLELYDASYHLIDPYAGACNPSTASSWWKVQRPYNDSAVIKLMTGTAPVSFNSCPSPDVPNEATYFQAGDSVYFTVFYRDQLSSQISTYRLIKPDGNVYSQWTHKPSQSYSKVSYWWWAFDLGPNEPPGTWALEVEFEETLNRYEFHLAAPSNGTPQPTATPMGTPAATVTSTPLATATPGATSTPSPEPTQPPRNIGPGHLFLPGLFGSPVG